MTKSQLKSVMKREYEKGISKYNKLWDTFNYLYSVGLMTDNERETIKAYNHELSKSK